MPDNDSSPPVAHAEFKAVTLLAAIVALICAFVLYVMAARGVFEETQRLILLTDNSEGIKSGMDLTFSGFPIGRVNRVELAADGNVRVLIDVDRKDAHWLRTSSVFTMERSLVGETKIRAFTGILSDPPLPDSAERMALRGDASEQIPQVMNAMRTLLENLQAMTSENAPLNASMRNVQSVTARMQGKHGVLAGILGNDEEAHKLIAALERTNALLEKMDARVFAKGGVMDDAQATIKQVHELLRESRESLKTLDTILANTQGATTDLVSFRAEVENSLRKTSQLIEEINRKWPFSRDTEIKLP